MSLYFGTNCVSSCNNISDDGNNILDVYYCDNNTSCTHVWSRAANNQSRTETGCDFRNITYRNNDQEDNLGIPANNSGTCELFTYELSCSLIPYCKSIYDECDNFICEEFVEYSGVNYYCLCFTVNKNKFKNIITTECNWGSLGNKVTMCNNTTTIMTVRPYLCYNFELTFGIDCHIAKDSSCRCFYGRHGYNYSFYGSPRCLDDYFTFTNGEKLIKVPIINKKLYYNNTIQIQPNSSCSFFLNDRDIVSKIYEYSDECGDYCEYGLCFSFENNTVSCQLEINKDELYDYFSNRYNYDFSEGYLEDFKCFFGMFCYPSSLSIGFEVCRSPYEKIHINNGSRCIPFQTYLFGSSYTWIPGTNINFCY